MDGVILAIETSGENGGAAVLRAGKLLAEAEVSGPRTHGAELMPCIERALRDAKLDRRQIDVVAVNCGPGSYTGLRIGIATAQTIGFALEKPVVGVACFETMALQYVMQPDFNVKLRRELWPVLDARRNEVMTAKMLYAKGELVRATADLLLAPDKLHEQAERKAIVFGNGVLPYQGLFNQDHLFIDRSDFVLKPGSVALQAYRQLANVDAAAIERKPVEPRYFRRVLAKTVEERAREQPRA